MYPKTAVDGKSYRSQTIFARDQVKARSLLDAERSMSAEGSLSAGSRTVVGLAALVTLFSGTGCESS